MMSLYQTAYSLSLAGALVGALLARRPATKVGAGRLMWITALINGLASRVTRSPSSRRCARITCWAG
jgi:hypothetical protein